MADDGFIGFPPGITPPAPEADVTTGSGTRRVGRPEHPEIVVTVRGVGYRAGDVSAA